MTGRLSRSGIGKGLVRFADTRNVITRRGHDDISSERQDRHADLFNPRNRVGTSTAEMSRIRAALSRARCWLDCHSPQSIKVLKASFPPDRWPAREVTGPDGYHAIRVEGRDRDTPDRTTNRVYDYSIGGRCAGAMFSISLDSRKS